MTIKYYVKCDFCENIEEVTQQEVLTKTHCSFCKNELEDFNFEEVIDIQSLEVVSYHTESQPIYFSSETSSVFTKSKSVIKEMPIDPGRQFLTIFDENLSIITFLLVMIFILSFTNIIDYVIASLLSIIILVFSLILNKKANDEKILILIVIVLYIYSIFIRFDSVSLKKRKLKHKKISSVVDFIGNKIRKV